MNMNKKTFKLSGMHCSSCSLIIEGELEDIGVVAKANYAKQMVDVEYDTSKITEDLIVETIEKQGYKVVAK